MFHLASLFGKCNVSLGPSRKLFEESRSGEFLVLAQVVFKGTPGNSQCCAGA